MVHVKVIKSGYRSMHVDGLVNLMVSLAFLSDATKHSTEKNEGKIKLA